MPRRGTTHVTGNRINFTNEEVATLRAFAELPGRATKAEIQARAKQILDEMKEITRKKSAYPLPASIFGPKRGSP